MAAELDLARWFGGQFWFPQWDPSRASILEIVELFRAGRGSAHAFMNWQTKEQLEVDYVPNAEARALDSHTVEVPTLGRSFDTRNIVLGLGAHTRRPDLPGVDLPDVFDYATLVEDLDYEPRRRGDRRRQDRPGVRVVLPRHLLRHDHRDAVTDHAARSMHHVDEDLRRYVEDGMRKRGVEILTGAHPLEIKGADRVERVLVQLADGETREMETDFVFLGMGERPNSAPAREWLGVALGVAAEVVVDPRMRTSVEGVYAIGDLIAAPSWFLGGMRLART